LGALFGGFEAMSGLLALLDDVAALAQVAAASLDDTVTQAAAASAKAAGIVIDDTAVTPRYVMGFAADRELPIVARIAWGSLKNKLLYLLPGALGLSLVAPWSITPLLMMGGAYLCFEGYEKVQELFAGPAVAAAGETTAGTGGQALDPKALEDERVSGAIRTDLILSAEIMAIALASVASATFLVKAASLGVVALLVTAGVYGLVALIVKADDIGLVLARSRSRLIAWFGRGLVTGMPPFLSLLSLVGTLAMLWVGGGIVVHGLHELGWHAPQDAITALAQTASGSLAGLSGAVAWLVGAMMSGVIGLALGFVTERIYHAVKRWLPRGPRFTAD
jgi:uncharacterized protein